MDIEKIIKEFAETYHFLQQKDVEMVENSEFDRENYLKIYNKKYISIDKNEISVGEIIIDIDSYDEQEWYTIDKHPFFRININDYLTEESLINEIAKECRKYNLI